jgi:hypothetical protein
MEGIFNNWSCIKNINKLTIYSTVGLLYLYNLLNYYNIMYYLCLVYKTISLDNKLLKLLSSKLQASITSTRHLLIWKTYLMNSEPSFFFNIPFPYFLSPHSNIDHWRPSPSLFNDENQSLVYILSTLNLIDSKPCMI